MEGKKKTYWKGIEQLTNDSEFVKYAEKEFPENLPINDTFGDNSSGGTSRRDFLKMMGFSVAAVSLAACETPIKKAIPYLNKPENVDPGIPNYYASTYLDGSDYCSVVVKTREGRPIFVQGNEFSKVTFGGTSARANASIMSLYDIEKAQFASKKGQKIDWKTADQEIIKELANVASSGKDIRIVANTLMSPSTKLAINQFIAKYPTAKLVMYDQISASGMLEANNKYFGKSVLPSYSFDKANIIVSIGADFLGAWISPVEFNKQFSKTRKVGKDRKEMSRLYAFETLMSITGGAADYRNTYKPSQEGLVVANLYNLIAEKAGKNKITAAEVKLDKLKKAADDLWASKGKSLVVAGSNDTNVQLIVNAINEMLESYGNTINMSVPLFTKQGSDSDMDQLIKDVTGSKIGAIIFYNANPVYDHPLGGVLATSLKNVALTISTADRLEETAELCTYNTPDSHFLESWNDAEPKLGHFSLGQPTITTIFETRQTQQSLLVWASSEKTYLDIIKEYWKELFKLQNKETEFEVFWKTSLHHGVFQPAISASFQSVHLGGGAVKAVAMPVEEPKKEDAKKVEVKKEEPKKEEVKPAVPVSSSNFDVTSVDLSKYKANNEGIELVIYEKSIVGSGSQANNPFLHETPDPISKACWGNYISVSQITSREKGFITREGKTNVA
ncbi:MAG: molybdopterin oxidoreductase, partial [Bacteroidetes bacterium]